jgi:Icc-related predicted phosphoesterase
MSLQNTEYKGKLLEKAMLISLIEWLNLGKKWLAGTNMRTLLRAGNDDTFSIDQPISSYQNENVQFVEEETVRLDEHNEMLNQGDTNVTLRHLQREYSEEELYFRLHHGRIQKLSRVADIEKTVCINPKSKCVQGVLRGVIVKLLKGRLVNYALSRG